ncbi:MAG TPA: hypothetical protein VF377_09360 [Acidimicrobiia bacterium]
MDALVVEAVVDLDQRGVVHDGVGHRDVAAAMVEEGEDLRTEFVEVGVAEREPEIQHGGRGHHRADERGIGRAGVEAPIVPVGEDHLVWSADAAVELHDGRPLGVFVPEPMVPPPVPSRAQHVQEGVPIRGHAREDLVEVRGEDGAERDSVEEAQAATHDGIQRRVGQALLHDAEEALVSQAIPQRLGRRAQVTIRTRADEPAHPLGCRLVGVLGQVDEELAPLGQYGGGEPGADEGDTVAGDDVVDEAVGDFDVTHR